jgi:hypothetical protein
MLMGGGEIIHSTTSRVVYPFLSLPLFFLDGFFEDSPKWVATGVLVTPLLGCTVTSGASMTPALGIPPSAASAAFVTPRSAAFVTPATGVCETPVSVMSVAQAFVISMTVTSGVPTTP